MGTEFFDELGETFTRTARGISERAGQFYEMQKLRNKISGEDRIIDKVMADLGNIIYRRYADGEELDEAQLALCREIDQHKAQIARYKDTLADMKGQKVCPACQASVDREASFCPNCGAPVPTPEPEKAEEETVEEESTETETAEEETTEEETTEEGTTEEGAAEEETAAAEAEAETEEESHE